MTFQLKNFVSIVASMINVARASQNKITDFSVGSVARTLMESPAVEIEELYLQMFLGLQDAIPVSIYQAFGFGIVEDRPSGGLLSATFPELVEGLVIPKGSVFEVPGSALVFHSTETISVAAGGTHASIPVVCASAGTVGNILADSITDGAGLARFPIGSLFTNLPFTTGMNAESEIERKTRFANFIASVARGTIDSIRYCAAAATVLDGDGLVQEYVSRVGIDEHTGYLLVYIYGSLDVPSTALLNKVQSSIDGYVDISTGNKINGYRPAGVSVSVLPMLERYISIGLSVSTRYASQMTDELFAEIVNAIEKLIISVEPGSVLRADEITGCVLSIDGVITCNFTNNHNEVCGQFERLVPGAISVDWIINAQ